MKHRYLPSFVAITATTAISFFTLSQSKTEAAVIGRVRGGSNSNSNSSSLVFVDANNIFIPGFDHVALVINEQLYEAHSVDRGIIKDRKLSDIKFPYRRINIDQGSANQLKTQIETKLGFNYQELNPLTILTPFQKGRWGKFTCVGLIEWAAEAAGFNSSQGYIWNINEYIYLPAGFVPTLTPSLLYWSIENPIIANNTLLHMILDPADFILTDPLGRRFGYTQELGLIREIPNVFYTGDNWAEQLALGNLIDGEYTLEVFGLDDNATVAFGNGNSGDYFSGYLAKGESKILKFNKSKASSVSTPESSSILGLTILGFLGGLLRKRNR